MKKISLNDRQIELVLEGLNASISNECKARATTRCKEAVCEMDTLIQEIQKLQEYIVSSV